MDQIGSWASPFHTYMAQGVELAGQPIPGPLYEVARIHFATNSSVLDERDKSRLAYLASGCRALLIESPRPLKFHIVGFSDERGSDALNRDLSTRRAQAVATHFQGLLVPKPTKPGVVVSFVVRGEGKAREPASSPLVSTQLRSRGDRPPSAASWQALARWRRVSIYANVSGAPVSAGIEQMKRSFKKVAERAYEGHRKQIEGIKRLVDVYKRRLGRGHNAVTDYNTAFLAWYETRLKDRRQSFDALKKAIASGDDAFLKWMQRKRRPYAEFVADVTARLEKEVHRFETEKTKAPPEAQKLLAQIIEGLKHEIEFLRDELKYIEN